MLLCCVFYVISLSEINNLHIKKCYYFLLHTKTVAIQEHLFAPIYTLNMGALSPLYTSMLALLLFDMHTVLILTSSSFRREC